MSHFKNGLWGLIYNGNTSSMDAYNGLDEVNNNWSGLTIMDAYKERVAYDANGNILKYLRNEGPSDLDMDSLTYKYNRDGSGNLGRVTDNSQRGDASYWDSRIIDAIRNSGVPNPGGDMMFVDGVDFLEVQ